MLIWARVTRTVGYRQSFHHREGWDLPPALVQPILPLGFLYSIFLFPSPQESDDSRLLHLGTTQVSWQKSGWNYSSGSPLKNLLNAGHRGAHF